MTASKYGHLIKPLPVRKMERQWANAQQLAWMYGKDLNAMNLNFAWGVYEKTGNWHDWAPGGGPHTHPYDECLVFVGHDTDDLTYLGAEIEVSMGKELEKHVFDKATAVIVPRGMVHCPVVAKKVEKPYSHYHIALGGEYKTDWVTIENESPESEEKKYGHLIKPLPVIKGPGGANADHIAWLQGKDLEGFNLNFTWGVYSGLGDWEKGRDPHVHPYDECLVFVGHNTDDLTYLGAELEISMGKEEEKHVINQASVVIVPKGLPHCPLITKSVEKPFGFYLIALGPEMKYTWLGLKK